MRRILSCLIEVTCTLVEAAAVVIAFEAVEIAAQAAREPGEDADAPGAGTVGELMALPVVFVEMQIPLSGLTPDVEWRMIAQDGTRLDCAATHTFIPCGWAVASSYVWARHDSGLTNRYPRQRVSAHYPDGCQLIEVSGLQGVTTDLQELYEAALTAYALRLEAA